MLAKYLTKVRKDRVLSVSAANAALENLGAAWTIKEKTLTKEFLFPTYEGANNFQLLIIYYFIWFTPQLRFNEYCSKINRTPTWTNVYNRVKVELKDHEFNDITSKDFEVAKYLDVVYDVTLNFDEYIAKDRVVSSPVFLIIELILT